MLFFFLSFFLFLAGQYCHQCHGRPRLPTETLGGHRWRGPWCGCARIVRGSDKLLRLRHTVYRPTVNSGYQWGNARGYGGVDGMPSWNVITANRLLRCRPSHYDYLHCPLGIGRNDTLDSPSYYPIRCPWSFLFKYSVDGRTLLQTLF